MQFNLLAKAMQHGRLHAGGTVTLDAAGVFDQSRNEKLGECDVDRPELAAVERLDRFHHRIEQLGKNQAEAFSPG